MRKSNRIRLPGRVSRRARLAAVVFAAVLVTAACQTISFRVIKHNRLDTSGRARGVATQDQYAFVADGDDGLKILNISNPTNLKQTGALGLPGFAGRVAVEGDVAVVTDATQNRVHVVDVSDKFGPVLKWTFKTLDIAREVAIQGSVAFLAERGDDPLGPAYFSGVEAVSCKLTAKPASLNSAGIKNIRDVAVTSGHVFILDPGGLTVLSRSAKGFVTAPLATMIISATEDLQSIDGRAGTHLLVLGKSLYLVDATSASKPVVRDQAAVSGYAQYRVVTSSGVLSAGSSAPSSQPQFVRFAYSTLHEYGIGMAELTTQKILFVALAVDLDKESQGHLQLYEIEMRKDFAAFYASGDALAVGVLDNYGLGVAF
jgi:hypothetical protein